MFPSASLFKRILSPPKLAALRSVVGSKPLRILDVGCGNESCKITRTWLNVIEYHGVDKEHWHGKDQDYALMDQVFYIDLDSLDLRSIPESYYDVVIFSHVIEHLANGEMVLLNLSRKLKPGGFIYVETPSERTLHYPSAIGFLNFKDDPTHVKVYPLEVLDRVQKEAGLERVFSRVRRDWRRVILLSPLALALNLVYFLPVKRKLFASGLWDLLGVAVQTLYFKKESDLSGQPDAPSDFSNFIPSLGVMVSSESNTKSN